MWQRNRMEVYNTKQVKEQFVIHRQSNGSHQQHESWKSMRMALNYNPDYQSFPSKLPRYSEVTNPRCSCDTCSLMKAQAMDRYYNSQGRPPLYLTSWPPMPPPQSYKEGFYPAQGSSYLQPQYGERSQPLYPRGVPVVYTQHAQGPIYPHPLPIEPQPRVQIPHPAVQPESRTYETSEIHDSPSNLSPPSAFNTSPTLTSKGSVTNTPLRPGGIAYDHHYLPKIVAVHSLPSSPVYVREQLMGATLVQMGSNVPNVYASQSSDDTESYPKLSHRVCLENRYSDIELRTDTLAETQKTSALSEETNVEDNDTNDKDQSNTESSDKHKAENPLSQLPISPQHHDEAITVCQENNARLKDVFPEQNIRTLLRRITAWQIDFNEETDEIKKCKILNLIIEARAKLENLRLNRDYRNIPRHLVLTSCDNDSSKAKEATVGIVANDEATTAGETTGSNITMETQSDDAASPNIFMETKSDMRMVSPEVTIKTEIDEDEATNVTMETKSDMRMVSPEVTIKTEIDEDKATNATMETKSDMRMVSPEVTIKTEIDEDKATNATMETKSDMRMVSPEVTIKTEIEEDEAMNVTMETCSNSDVQESDAISNMVSSFSAETTTNSVMETNTYQVVSNANASNTVTSTGVTMTISNTDMTNKTNTMETFDNYSTFRGNSRSSPLPEDSASCTLSSKRSKIDPRVIMADHCQTSCKTTLLQPRIVVNLFDRVKLFDRRKKLLDVDDPAPKEHADAQDENGANEVTTRVKRSQSDISENKISGPNINQIDGELNSKELQQPEVYNENCTRNMMTRKNKSQSDVSENMISGPNLNQIDGELNSKGLQQPEVYNENCTRNMMTRKNKSQSDVSENKISVPNLNQIDGELNSKELQQPEVYNENCTRDIMTRKSESQSDVGENMISGPNLNQIDGELNSKGLQQPEVYNENCTRDIMIRKYKSQSDVGENSFLDPDLNQIHGETGTNNEGSQQLSPALSPNIIKDPFAATEIRKMKQAGHTTESDSDDVWTMELDESSQKAVFRRRWKRTGGPFDRKRTALDSQATDENEESTQSEEWFSEFNESSSPLKKRAFLELRIIETEHEDNENDEQIINEAIQISPIFKNLTSGPVNRSIHSMEDPISSIYPTDQAELQDFLANDIEMFDSPSNEPSAYSQDADVEAASSDEDFEESIYILERSLQLRDSKIQRLHDKKEQLLDELKRIKANSLSSLPRDS